MRLDDQAVGAGGDGGAGQRRNEFARAGGVAGIDDDRQVRKLLGDGDAAQIEQIARAGVERAQAALAEHDLGAAVDDQIFGGGEPFLDGAGQAALEQHGAAGLGDLLEQVVVLRVARADLEHVGQVEQGLDLVGAGHFRDQGDVELLFDRAHDLEAVLLEALEIVGRSAGLEGHGADDADAAADEILHRGAELVIGFDGARTGEDLDVPPADLHAADVDHGIGPVIFARDELELLLDGKDGFHGRQIAQDFEGLVAEFVADAGDDGLFDAADDARLVAQGADHVADGGDVGIGAVSFQDDDHGEILGFKVQRLRLADKRKNRASGAPDTRFRKGSRRQCLTGPIRTVGPAT